MAAVARTAPRPGRSALVADSQLVKISRGLVDKILQSIPDTHRSCISSQALQLNSSENSKLEMMATTIGIPSAPVLKAVSESFTLETGLRRVSEGLQLHKALLSSVSPHLENRQKKDKVAELVAELRDLDIQINKMLRKIEGESAVQATAAPVTLNLPGSYEVQVAAHMTLVQLQSFGQDVGRFLRTLVQSNEDETER